MGLIRAICLTLAITTSLIKTWTFEDESTLILIYEFSLLCFWNKEKSGEQVSSAYKSNMQCITVIYISLENQKSTNQHINHT